MQNILLAFALLISSLSALACQPEAQISATAGSVQKLGDLSCVVQIDLQTIVSYQANETCPLDSASLAEEKVEVGVKADRSCRVQTGEPVSGYLIRNSAGQLVLE